MYGLETPYTALIYYTTKTLMPPSHWATFIHDAEDHATFWNFAWKWCNLGQNLTINVFFSIFDIGGLLDTLSKSMLRLHNVYVRFYSILALYIMQFYGVSAKLLLLLPRCFHVLGAAATTMLLKVRVDWAAARCIQFKVRCYYICDCDLSILSI